MCLSVGFPFLLNRRQSHSLRGGCRQEEERETDADSEAWGSDHTRNVWRSVVTNLK